MKSLLAIALTLFAFQAFSQVSLPKNDEGKVEISEVVSVEGLELDALLENAKRWFGSKYKAEKNRKVGFDFVSDIQNFKSDSYSGGVNYTITVSVRSGRYKVTFTEMRHKDYDGKRCSGGELSRDEPHCVRGTMSKKEWEKVKADTEMQVKQLMMELKAEMEKKPKADTEDDW